MHCRLVSNSPGLHPLDTVAPLFQLEQPKLSEDIASRVGLLHERVSRAVVLGVCSEQPHHWSIRPKRVPF